MIQVSNKFKEKVYAPIRKTTAKVTFEFLNLGAYKDNTLSFPAESPISRAYQIVNKNRTMSRKYATFEPDYFKLDGGFHIPPRPNEGDYELGYWSDDLCDENGFFVPHQVITIEFGNPHSSIGFSITFDPMADECAEEFDIAIYDENNAVIHLENVTENSEPLYVLEKPLNDYKKIIVTIKKWCKGYRRARVSEVDFGVVKEYQGDKLIKLNIIEEINLIGDQLPSNEIQFTIDNSDRKFNILNPYGYYRFLRERQEVNASIGLQINDIGEEQEEYEYIPMGKYYLIDWQSDEGALTTTFIARDNIETLEDIEYESITNTNLYDLAEDILVKAGIEEYEIDSRLKTIPTAGFPETLTSREALQCIGIAGQCMVYQDRYGVLQIRHFETLSESTGYIHFAGMDAYAGMITPAVDESYDFKYINFGNVYNEPQIKLDTLVKSVTIIVYDGTEEGQKTTVYNDGVSKGYAPELDNPLINTVEHAQGVAKWIIRESNLRAIYEVDWRQNPALECGDAVLIDDSYNAKKRARVIKNEFNFDGALSGKTSAKGGV